LNPNMFGFKEFQNNALARSSWNPNFTYTTFTGVFCCFEKHKRNRFSRFVVTF
jgi:hypothetical protein